MEYKVIFYTNPKGKCQVREYLEKQTQRDQAKIIAYIDLLKNNAGYLDEPYSRHLYKKIRELKIKRHCVLYSVLFDKKIILLHAFFKDTDKTPQNELNRAINNYNDYIESEDSK